MVKRTTEDIAITAASKFLSAPAKMPQTLPMASAESQLTPMMAQYRRIKGELPKDALLLFRLGDFYEMFFEDAQAGAQILNLALTSRNGVPMCGLPFHAANNYIARVLKSGRKVAICEQLEDARPGKLVKREVTQILSPGTHFDERMLVAERNNFLAAVNPAGRIFGLAVVDLTTGDFLATELDAAALVAELERLRPAEIIFPGEQTAVREILGGRVRENAAAQKGISGSASAATGHGWILSGYDDWTFAPETAFFTVREQFKVATLDGFGLKDKTAAIGAAGASLHYLTQNLRRDVKHLTRISFYQRSDFLALDCTTLRHLEILEPLHHDAPRNSSLYGALNRTVTPMGARLMRQWLSQPLAAVAPIRRRQDAVQTLMENSFGLDGFRQQLARVRDLERTIGRLSTGSGNARDLAALRQALEQLPALKSTLRGMAARNARPPVDSLSDEVFQPDPSASSKLAGQPGEPPPGPALLEELESHLAELPDLVELISRAIVDEPPLPIKEGGMIRDGFDAALDDLRQAQRGGKDWIAKLQADEISRTGISSLKVRFNSVFGYYIEITRANLDKVPPQYIRKQTIANGERFITPELKEMEGRILGAEERSVKLEYELFQRVREEVLGQLPRIQPSASALAQLDVLAAFAETARLHNYARPQMGDGGIVQIRDGRHPVLEQQLVEERFVPNDTELANTSPSPPRSGGEGRGEVALPHESGQPPTSKEMPTEQSPTTSGAALHNGFSGKSEKGVALPQIALITGPNMAGKSTYIRQVALLALLAHTGSFIPVAEARIDLLDRIFTRIGASDDLARGQSTFMVEMTETANILNNATSRSLIVLDEIGRGTSTFDGLSLAWSIVEHLHNQVGAKTLFATHYHELTELAARLPRLKNFNVAVREWHDSIVFLRKIVAGGTDKSYGIQVARLAGVPKAVLERAKQILSNLEESELTPEGNVRPPRRQQDRDKLKSLAPAPQLDLFR
jgi:DNA mismatch repair protein MutS